MEKLREQYEKEVIPALMKKFEYKSVMQVPKLEKIVINIGLGGLSKNSFDGKGNYSLGIKEQLIFPEIEYDKIDKIRGMDIIFVTTAKTDEEARELLTLMGMPFRV